VGSPPAPARTAAPPERWPTGEACDERGQDAERTFLVAMVASATITTSSKSFFMVASVAGAAPGLFPSPALCSRMRHAP
jgi:hypothetical protein